MTKSPFSSEDKRRRIEAVKAMARGICSSQGPRPACVCAGDMKHCLALPIYGDLAISALLALERAGFMLLGPIDDKDTLTDKVGRGTMIVIHGDKNGP